MKKLKLFAVISLFCAAFLLGCSNPVGDDSSNKSGSNNNQQEDSSKTPVTPEKTDSNIKIVKETFAGQVYYLDELDQLGNRSAERAAASAAEASKGIDTTRDRIVFAETGNGYTLYIGDKSYEGTYEVDLDKREISLTGNDADNSAVELSGTLSFSADAKSVEFDGIAKDASGKETRIEKKGQIKWDWSELGEWKQESFEYRQGWNNFNKAFAETGYVQLWRGEIDFTNSVYTRGIKIPATAFSNAKAGDYIAFLRQDNGRVLSIKNDGPKLKSRLWYSDIQNYQYDIYSITQELLDYINTNQGFNIYGNYGILEGIIIGSEGSVEVSLKNFFSRDYSGSGSYYAKDGWTLAFHYYVDSVHNRYTIVFDFTKRDVKDAMGLNSLSPDKNIYRRYKARGNINDLEDEVDVVESTFVLEEESLDKKFLNYCSITKADGETIKLKEYAEDPVKMKFDIQRVEADDTYILSFIDVPNNIQEYLQSIKKDSFSLTCYPYSFNSQDVFTVNYNDLSETGCLTSPTVGTDKILVWEGELDYTESNYKEGFYIPKEKLQALEENDKIYIIYPSEGKKFEFAEDIGDRKNKNYYFSIIIKDYLNNNLEDTPGVYYGEFTSMGVELVKENGLKVACNGNKVVKILIGKKDSVDSYFSELTN